MPLLEEYANAAALLEQHMPHMPLPTNLEQAGAHLRNEYAALAEQLRLSSASMLLFGWHDRDQDRGRKGGEALSDREGEVVDEPAVQ